MYRCFGYLIGNHDHAMNEIGLFDNHSQSSSDFSHPGAMQGLCILSQVSTHVFPRRLVLTLTLNKPSRVPCLSPCPISKTYQ